MSVTSANRLELIKIAESVAQEKQIDQELVIQAVEDAMARAAKTRYGQELDIKATIDRKTGDEFLTRIREVVETVEDSATQISLEEASRYRDDPLVGDRVIDELPPVSFGRIATQSAKQVILQKVREAEREKQYEEFKDRAGTIMNGVVKRDEYGNVIVDIGQGEGILRRDQKIGRESARSGERLRTLIREVRRENRGPQVFLSRTDPKFMEELFKIEVPEIYQGLIEIKSVARDPGSRAKIAVVSHDSAIDPVGACVGMRGSRVQAVVNELQGEKIDIIPWSEDPPTFLVNALQPAEVTKVIVDEDDEARIEVVVPDDQLSLAIGKRGQNVRLASMLTRLEIDITTESQDAEKRQQEFNEKTKMFMERLDVDEVVAQLLVTEGFRTLEEMAYVESEELLAIHGFDQETADELQQRARDIIDEANKAAMAKAEELGVKESLKSFAGLTPQMLVALAEDGITTLEEFATCADWELAGGWTTDKSGKRKRDQGLLEKFGMGVEEAQSIIMKARVEAGLVNPEDLEMPGEESPEGEDSGEAPGEGGELAEAPGEEGELTESQEMAGLEALYGGDEAETAGIKPEGPPGAGEGEQPDVSPAPEKTPGAEAEAEEIKP